MSASEESQASSVRVFISYSHDSREHCDQVLEFAQQLRRDGIDAKLDQFEELPAQGWPLWCARQILDAGYVLLICTEIYRKRFLGLEEFGNGRGVKMGSQSHPKHPLLRGDQYGLHSCPFQ